MEHVDWRISCIGDPESVVAYLYQEAQKLSGQARREYDDALPHLVGLVKNNFNAEHPEKTPILKLTACGDGSADKEEHGFDYFDRRRICVVSLEIVTATLLAKSPN